MLCIPEIFSNNSEYRNAAEGMTFARYTATCVEKKIKVHIHLLYQMQDVNTEYSLYIYIYSQAVIS